MEAGCNKQVENHEKLTVNQVKNVCTDRKLYTGQLLDRHLCYQYTIYADTRLDQICFSIPNSNHLPVFEDVIGGFEESSTLCDTKDGQLRHIM